MEVRFATQSDDDKTRTVTNNLQNLGISLRYLGNTRQASDTLIHAYNLANSLNDADLKYSVLAELYEVSRLEKD